MKYKVSRDEVFRLWARQSQESAGEKGNRERSYFRGNTCYSYGSHFPIAKHVGDNNVLFTLQTNSVTTADHISHARSACSSAGLNVIYCYDIDSFGKSIQHWEGRIEDLFEQISNPKNRKFEGRVQELRTIAQQFKKYIAFMNAEIPFKTATALALIESGNIVEQLREPDREFTASKKPDLKKQIANFVALITEDNLPMPDAGDCFLCSFQTQANKPVGDLSNGADHLVSHIEEKYLHGSLLVNAMKDSGYHATQIQLHYHIKNVDAFKRALRKYLNKKLITQKQVA